MLVRESISFERGGDPKEVLGIGDHVRIRNLKVRDIIVLKNDRFSSFNHRIAVIIDINYDNNNKLYIKYAGFGHERDSAKIAAKSINLDKYVTDESTKTLKEWDKIIIDIIKN